MSRHLTDRYQQAKRVAMAAAELAGSAREAWVDAECGDDADLLREVRWMLSVMESTHTATLPLRPAAAVDLIGHDAQVTTPHQYRIVRKLGEGGMGTVYLAERSDGQFVQKVALKLLTTAAEGSPILAERFCQERRLLARLEHDGIARLLDGGALADGKPFLAMEYVEGERIDAWCDRHGLDLPARVALFLKVCGAVEYAHRNLVIHRDIKPANILVTEDGTPKLLDFGIARVLDDHAEVQATATAHDAMTLAYASPEQIERQPLTTAADVYSLGVVLYQLVAGQRPYQHLSTPHLLSNAIISGNVVPPSRAVRQARVEAGHESVKVRSVPADIDAIVLKALRRRVDQRYPGVESLAADLRRFLRRRPVLARKGRHWYRTRLFIQRNRWPLAAAASLVAVVLAGLVSSLYALGQARDARALAETRQHQLERIVGFQRSMLESVNIDAMGQALARASRDYLRERLRKGARMAGPSTGAAPDSRQLDEAFAAMPATDTARNLLDTFVVTHALESLDRGFAHSPLLAADMRQSLARVLVAIGSYEHAAREIAAVLAVRRRLLPADADGILTAEIDLGRVQLKANQLAAAAETYRQLAQQVAKRPQGDPVRIEAEGGYAEWLLAAGQPREALAKQDALYVQASATMSPGDPLLLRLRRERVLTLISLGLRDRARKELEPLVQEERKALGEEDPATLDTMLSLAQLLYSQENQYERSLALARQVARIRERLLGADHPATLQARGLAVSNEVRLAMDGAAMKQVASELSRVIEARARVLGADHPDTLESMTDMVRLLGKQGRFRASAALEKRILDARLRTLGPDHYQTLIARGSLANQLFQIDRYPEAIDQARQTLAGLIRTLGPDHPMTLATYDLISRIESSVGHWQAARSADEKALEGRVKTLGKLDPHTIESANGLYEDLLHLDPAAAAVIRTTYLDPVIALDPATINASMRDVRTSAVDLVAQHADHAAARTAR